MYFQFLIEDLSSSILIDIIMKKISQQYPEVIYKNKSFHGLGKLTKTNSVKETKNGTLLNDLATYLRAFNKSLQGINAAIFIIVDNDDREPNIFQNELQMVAQKNNITADHVFCIAVEEVEAWLLGDKNAVLSAYPRGLNKLFYILMTKTVFAAHGKNWRMRFTPEDQLD